MVKLWLPFSQWQDVLKCEAIRDALFYLKTYFRDGEYAKRIFV